MLNRIIKIITIIMMIAIILGSAISSNGEAASDLENGSDTGYETIYIEKKDDGGGYNSKPLSYVFQPGKIYIFTVDKIEITDGETNGVTVALYNDTKKTYADSTEFFFPENEKTILNGQYIFTVPNNKDKYRLYLYAGIKEWTFGVGIWYDGVRVSEYHEEGNQ